MSENANRKDMFIPVNVTPEVQKIPGLGVQELKRIGMFFAAGLCMGVAGFMFTGNAFYAVVPPGTGIVVSFGLFVKDRYNESFLDKLGYMLEFLKTQKRYEYEFLDIYGEEQADEGN